MEAMMSFWRSMLLAIVTVAFTFSGVARADELCSSVAKAMAAADTKFASIQGASQPGDRWQSKVQVPGFKGCQIVMVGATPSFLCFSAPLSSGPEAAARAKTFADQIAKCTNPPGQVVHNDIGNTVMDMIFAPDFSAGASLISNEMIFDPTTGLFSEGWQVQLMISGNAEASSDGDSETQPTNRPEPAREESSRPAKFEVKAENLCSSVKSIVDAGLKSKDFASIRGEAIDESSWRVSVRPQGAFDCGIKLYSYGGHAYRCNLLETTNRDSAGKAFDDVDGALGTCFGDSWIPEATTKGTDRQVRYTNEDNDVRVRLILSKLLNDWTIRLSIDRE